MMRASLRRRDACGAGAAAPCPVAPWCPAPGFDVDVEFIHQPLGAEQPEAHAGRGLVRTGEDRLQVGDAGTAVAQR